MTKLGCSDFVLGLTCLLVVIYLLRFVCSSKSRETYPEYFEPTTPSTVPKPKPETEKFEEEEIEETTPEVYNKLLQEAILFSDVTVDPEERQAYTDLQENTKQIKSVDERFNEAKRKVAEHGMRPGIMPNKKRRQLVEALVRRPFCSRRTRSWRTEFSDNLRGDVVPKNKNNDLGMMRMGRSDPSIDLHPGALGQVSGLNGRWLATENVPDNTFDDVQDAFDIAN